MPTIDDLRRASGAYAQGRSDIELIDEYARLNKLSPLDAVRELNYTPLQSDNGKWGNRLGGAIDSYQGNWYGLGEALFGSQGLKRRRVENEFEAAVAREAAANQGAISSYKDINWSLGNAADYLGGLAVDSLPYLGEAALGGWAARGLSSGLRGTINAGRAADASVDTVRAAQAAEKSLGLRMAAGGAVASYPSAVGDILANQREANPDGPVDLTSAALGGVPYAALNMFGVEGLAARGSLGRGLAALDDAARWGKVKRGAAAVGMGSVSEGTSEAGQEVINQYFGRMAVNPNEQLFSPSAVDRYTESFIGGAALGGAFSGMGGWRKSQEYQNNQELQAAVLRETNMRAQQEQQQRDLLNPDLPANQTPEEFFIGGLPTFKQPAPTPAEPSFTDFYGARPDVTPDPYADIYPGGIAEVRDENIDLPRQVDPERAANEEAQRKQDEATAKEAAKAQKDAARARAKELLGYTSDKAVETAQALDAALADGRITQEQHAEAANSIATAKNTRQKGLAAKAAVVLATGATAPTPATVTTEAPANVSVPDASGLGVGSSGVQGSPVAGGSVEAAGRVPAPADGVPAAPASVPANPAQAAAVGDEVRGAGTAPLKEKKAPGTGKLADRLKGKSVVIGGAVDFKAMKLLLEPLSPKMHQAVRFALGVDKDGDRLDKPMSTPEAAAQVGVSRAELSRVMSAIGLDQKTRDRFFASSAAADERADGLDDESAGNTTDVRTSDEESDMVDGERDAADQTAGVIKSAGGSQSNIAAAPKKSFSKMAAYLAVKDKAPADVSDEALAEAVAEGSRYMSISASPNDKTGERARLDEAKKLLAPLMAEATRRQRSPSFQRAVAAAWERANPDSAKADDEAKPAEKDEDAEQEPDAANQPQDDAPVTAAAPAPAPKVVTKKKRTIVKPSKGKEARYAYLSAGALRRDLEGLFLGRGLGRKVVVVETFDDLADAMSPAELENVIAEELADPGAMQAFVANGRAFLIADRIGEDDGRAVFMHEVGAHLGLEKQLPTEAFNKLADLIKSWAKLTDLSKPMDRARNAVALRAVERLMAANTPKEQRNSELVAYFVEEAMMAGYNPTAVAEESVYGAAAQFIRRIVSAFKAALQKFGVDISKVTPRDIVDMAYGAAQIELYGNGAQKAFASAEAEAKFKAWFGKSTVVNEDGSPKIMYHGTAQDVEKFQPKQAGAIFLTDDPEFAEGFAQSSEFWMRANPQKWMKPDDFAKMLDEAEAKIRLRMERSGRLTGQASPGYVNANADLETIQRAKRGEFRTSWPVEIDSLVEKALPSSQNIIPLYVKAERPFDYTNREDVDKVLAEVRKKWPNDDQIEEALREGAWETVEHADVQAAIKLLGFDSFYVTENGRRNLAVYSPTQVKSAVGNSEFDPRDNRIQKSVRAAPRQAPEVPEHMTGTQPLPKVEQAIRSLPPVLRPGARKVAQLLRAAGRKVLNTAAFTDDLLDRAVSMGIKSAEKYKKLARERAASIGHQERMVLDAVTGFNNLDESLKGKDGPVNQYLWKTTTREAWGFQPDWLTEQVTIDKEMKAAFDALPAPAQKVVQDMLRHGHETLKAKKQLVMDMMVSEYDALIAAETDPEAKKALEADKAKSVKSSYGSLMRLADNKPYAPIKRFGSHVVIAKSQAYIDAELNGDQKLMRDLESQEEHYYVDFVDGEIAASDLEEKLKAKPEYAFTQYREIEEQRNDLYGGSKTLKAIGDLKAKIDGLPSSAERKELARMLQEMYLLQLGEDSARKSELRRRKIAGDIDMIRSFETQGLADARFMGQIQYGQPMLETMNDMRREVKDSKIGDANAKSEVFNELIKRHLQAMDYEPTPVINTLTRMSSMWFLATSPSYYLQNSTQPWMMSLPYMAAKHDYGKMAKLLSGAYGDVWGPLKDAKMFGQMDFKALLADENKSLTKGEKDMIRSLLDADRIDIGMANEIGQITAEVEARTAKGVYNKVDNSLRGLQQKLEAVNRLTSALAAYRAEIAAGSSEADATAYADDVIQRTHGDYSSWNAPRAFNTRGGKIMLQFRKYQLIQLTMMAKLFNNSFSKNSDEAKVARKALRNMMAQAFIVGGGKALPAGGLVAYVFSKLFGDDDEPPEMTFRKMVGNEDIADMLLYGAPAVAGINGAPYGGWGNSTSILPFTDIDLTSRKGVSEAGYALLSGPFGGLTLRAADGIGYIQNGDYWRGIENLLPKGFTNFSKAIREGSEGATNKRGDQLLTPEEVSYWQGLQQSLGLTPLSSTKRMVASDQLYSTRTDVKAEGARIKKDFLTARRNGDSAEMAAARKEWADYQDKRVRLGFDRQSLSELMKAGDQQRTREKLTRGGVQYRKGEEGFAEQLAVDEE